MECNLYMVSHIIPGERFLSINKTILSADDHPIQLALPSDHGNQGIDDYIFSKIEGLSNYWFE
jgi:hypothetical protein